MEELDLKELLQLFWEKKVQIILIVAIFAVVGVIYTMGFIEPKYQSSTRLLLTTNSSSVAGSESITATDVTLNSKLVSTYSVLVKSQKVIREVISNLEINVDEADIRKNVTVSAVSDAEVIEIKVKNTDPVLAAKITNEIAKVFIENVKEYYGIENVRVVDTAEVPTAPCNINHTKDVVIFAFAGLVLSAIYILIVNMLDTTIKSEEDIEKIQGLKVLAEIPIYETPDDKTKNKGKRRKV